MKLTYLFERCLDIAYTRVGDNADYAIEIKGDTLYIYFEKTTDCTDWKNNFDFPAKLYKSWYVHRGFLKVWQSVLPYLIPVIMDKSFKKIVIVGYSHGAALALLCHEYVWFHRPDIRNSVYGYGFGCPRVVWGIAPKNRWDNFTVIRNIDDIVTHLPPLFFGYNHVGKLLKIGESGRYSDTDAHRPENILIELKNYEKIR